MIKKPNPLLKVDQSKKVIDSMRSSSSKNNILTKSKNNSRQSGGSELLASVEKSLRNLSQNKKKEEDPLKKTERKIERPESQLLVTSKSIFGQPTKVENQQSNIPPSSKPIPTVLLNANQFNNLPSSGAQMLSGKNKENNISTTNFKEFTNGSRHKKGSKSLNKSNFNSVFKVLNETKNNNSNISFEGGKSVVENEEKSVNLEGIQSDLNNQLNSNAKANKGTTSSSLSSIGKLAKGIEVDSPEELHYFYVKLSKQNKNLAYKFENENYSVEKYDNIEF